VPQQVTYGRRPAARDASGGMSWRHARQEVPTLFRICLLRYGDALQGIAVFQCSCSYHASWSGRPRDRIPSPWGCRVGELRAGGQPAERVRAAVQRSRTPFGLRRARRQRPFPDWRS